MEEPYSSNEKENKDTFDLSDADLNHKRIVYLPFTDNFSNLSDYDDVYKQYVPSFPNQQRTNDGSEYDDLGEAGTIDQQEQTNDRSEYIEDEPIYQSQTNHGSEKSFYQSQTNHSKKYAQDGSGYEPMTFMHSKYERDEEYYEDMPNGHSQHLKSEQMYQSQTNHSENYALDESGYEPMTYNRSKHEPDEGGYESMPNDCSVHINDEQTYQSQTNNGSEHAECNYIHQSSQTSNDSEYRYAEKESIYLTHYELMTRDHRDIGDDDDEDCGYISFDKHHALSLQLRKTCCEKKPQKENDTNASSKIFHEMGILFMQENSSSDMLSVIRAAALFNAAISRNSTSKSQAKKSLHTLCNQIQREAGCSENKDLIQQAELVKTAVEKMREKARKALQKIKKISDDITGDQLLLLEKEKTQKIRKIQDEISEDYKNIMKNLCQFCENVMGRVPCSYALVGMGSLARREVTPYSDFEHVIILKDDCQHSNKNYDNILNYFRWYSLIFHVVIINLGETIIPSVAIPDLNDKNSVLGDWFYDAYTKRGISFDGMMPHACKFPLGRMEATKDKPFSTELIKPVSEMLEFLNSNESVKQGYHLADILTKTCFVYGDFEVYKDFAAGVIRKLNTAFKTKCFEDIKTQLEEDLKNFAINRRAISELHSNAMFNVKRLVYRSTTLFVSAWGRFEGINASSSFDIVSALRDKNVISEYVKSKLMYAVALACEIRLRTYLNQDKQGDMFEPAARDDGKEHSFVEVVGKSSLINYFQVAYALQASICKYLGTNTKPSHLITDPITFNVKVCSALGLEEMTNHLSQICVTSTVVNVDIFSFEDCLTYLEEGLQTNFQNSVIYHKMTTSSENAAGRKKVAYRYNYIGKYMFLTHKFDEALTFVTEAVNIMESTSAKTGIFHANCFELAGYCLTELKQYQQALICFNKAFDIHRFIAVGNATEQVKLSALSCYYEGLCYEKKKQYRIALECFQKALPVYDHEAYEKNVASTYYHLALCFIQLGDYSSSYAHLRSSFEIYKKLTNADNVNTEIAKALNLFVRSYKMKSLNTNKTKDLCDFRMIFQEYSQLLNDIFVEKNISLIFLDLGKNLMDLELLNLSYFWLQKSLTTYTTLMGPHDFSNDRIVGHVCCSIGLCLMKQSHYQQSLKYLNRALRVFKRSSSEVDADHDVAEAFRRIGLCYLAMKMTSRAKENLQNAVIIYETLSVDVESVKQAAEVLDDCVTCLMEMHDYEASINCLRISLHIKKRVSPNAARDHSIALTLNNIGICLMKLNKPAESVDWFRKALKIQQVTKTSPFGVVTTINNLGLCLMAMNNYYEAFYNFENAKFSIEKIFKFEVSLDQVAKQHMVDTLNNLGSCHLGKDEYDLALDAFSGALDYKRTLPLTEENDEITFYLLSNIGLCFMRLKSYHCSLKYFQQSLNLYECEISIRSCLNQKTDADELTLSKASLHNNIGLCLMHTGAPGKAILHFQQSIDLYGNRPANCDEDLAAVMHNLSVAYLNNGCYKKCSKNADDALVAYFKSSADLENNQKVAELLSVIGMCKRHLGLFKDALSYFERSLAIMRRISLNEKDQCVLRTLHECGLCLSALEKGENFPLEKTYLEMSLQCIIGQLVRFSSPSNNDVKDNNQAKTLSSESKSSYSNVHIYDKVNFTPKF